MPYRRCLLAASLGAALLAASGARADERQNDEQAIKRCFELWGSHHPFASPELPPYKVIASTMRVMGFNDELVDREQTAAPALILVKTAAPALARTRLRLLNANGWYCLKSPAEATAAAGTATVEIACDARLADVRQNAAALGPLDGADHPGNTGKTGTYKPERIRESGTAEAAEDETTLIGTLPVGRTGCTTKTAAAAP